MSKKIIAVIVIALLIVGGGVAWQAIQSQEEMNGEDYPEVETISFILTAEGREFYMDGEENPDIVVNEGDEVLIELVSEGGTHDFVIDEFDVATEMISEGETDAVQFTADQVGEFEYYCSVGTHRADGMYGNFIVEE